MMTNEVREAVEMAGFITTASNNRLMRGVSLLLSRNPDLLAEIQAEISGMTELTSKTSHLNEAQSRELQARKSRLVKMLRPVVSQAVEMGMIEAAPLAKGLADTIGTGGENPSKRLEAIAAATLIGSVAAKKVAERAAERALDAAFEEATEMQFQRMRDFEEYTAAMEQKEAIRRAVELDPDAVNAQGERLALKLRGAKLQEPSMQATEEDAFKFLEQVLFDSATSGRQEGEYAASTGRYAEGGKSMYLVTDSAACKVCRTIAGSGPLGWGTKFIHKNCGCTIRMTSLGEDDPVAIYNREMYGEQAEEAKALAVRRWQIPEDEAFDDRNFALVLGEANKTRLR